MIALMRKENIPIRHAQLSDLDDLVTLENASFDTDKLSRRSFRHSGRGHRP